MKFFAILLVLSASLCALGHSSFTISLYSTESRSMLADTAQKDTSCLLIPTFISPNSETFNGDVFLVSSKCPLKDYHITIFNRWGDLIFESEDINNSWDGTTGSKHEGCPPGVYIYVIAFQSKTDSPKKEYKGSVTLIR